MKQFMAEKTVMQNFTFSQETLWGKLVVILAGEFGAITMTVTYLLFLLLPLIVGFYLFLALLEDCGYLPRLATMVDRLLNTMGLNGRAVIPIILGFGCVTMATITTRLLNTSREKTIAASILNFAIPCSAQLAVITALLTKAGGEYTLIFFVIILANLIGIGTVIDKILPGKSSALLIDLPPMRLPRLDNVAKKTWIKTLSFMKEASPWFFVGALLISTMQVTGLLDVWIRLFEPITTNWLGLPADAARSFVMGMVRRDFGAAGLYELALSPKQIVVSLTVITLFVPCIASLMVLLKERGLREAMTIWFGSWILAFSIGGVVAAVL
jgi:ferrous iron transport protein B